MYVETDEKQQITPNNNNCINVRWRHKLCKYYGICIG